MDSEACTRLRVPSNASSEESGKAKGGALRFGVEIGKEGGYTYFMPDATPPVPPKPDQPKNDWAKATMWMVIVGFLGINGAIVFHSCRNVPGEALDKSGKLIEKAGRAMADVASAFTQGRITTEFTSYASSISNHSRLQFATLRQHEIFTRTEEMRTGFGYVPLPDVVVEARAPVEFTYYLDFNAKWDFSLKDGVLFVRAPPVRFNRPHAGDPVRPVALLRQHRIARQAAGWLEPHAAPRRAGVGIRHDAHREGGCRRQRR